MVSSIPAGSRLLAEDLLPWSTAINDMHTLNTVGASLVKARTSNASSIANDATLNDDTVLTFTSVPIGTYHCEYGLNWTSNGTSADIQIGWTMPSGGVIRGSTFFAQPTTATASVGNFDTGYNNVDLGSGSAIASRGAIGGVMAGFGYGLIILTTAGTVTLSWAQATSNANTLFIAAGSWMRLTRLV